METKRLKIVIIDNNVASITSFTKIITKKLPGTEVYSASNGMQGIKLARTHEPDVILIDTSMTEADGLKISRIIKRDKALQMTPMLFITDLENDRQMRIKAVKAGAEAFLIKPVDDTILITQLSAMAKVKERNILINTLNKQLEVLVEQRTDDLKQEIIERKRLEIELRKSEEIFRTYIEKAPLGIFVVDATGRYVDANGMACRLMGRTKEEVLGLSMSDYLVADHLEKGLAEFIGLKSKGFSEAEYRVRDKDGHEYWISLSGTRINDNCYIAFCSDISDRKEKEERVEYLSYHDILTGIYNRAYYEEEINRLDTERQLPFSIIISDVNGLKLINDTLGYAAGDRILVETAKILRRYTRKEDILARTGGDEFSILLPRTSSQEAQTIVARIQEGCQECRIDYFKETILLSISVGYATKTMFSESFSHITKLAEDYMYRRKLLERESFHSSLLESLRTSLFERSHETEEHAARLISFSRDLGTAMNLRKEQLNDLELLSALHDIGKISIDNSILIKPGRLTDEEWLEMKKHPAIGYRIAMASTDLRSIADCILSHHERWDGNGYPQGISGESIPILSRILSVVDAYDAMTSDRPYRKAMTKEDAIAEISSNSGTQFDPEIASLFLTLV